MKLALMGGPVSVSFEVYPDFQLYNVSCYTEGPVVLIRKLHSAPFKTRKSVRNMEQHQTIRLVASSSQKQLRKLCM